MSHGYGLSASLFQIAHAYTAFANGGKVIPITMLKTHEPPVGVPVFSELVAAQVRRMMHMAAAPGGTAPVFSAVVQQTLRILNVLPDLPVASQAH
jgi:cell division protein FtsI (penicillin-binding protein 3)